MGRGKVNRFLFVPFLKTGSSSVGRRRDDWSGEIRKKLRKGSGRAGFKGMRGFIKSVKMERGT